MIEWLRELLTRRRVIPAGEGRRSQMLEEEPTDRFIYSVALMIVFFAGLCALEIAHMAFLGRWNGTIFNGIMLIVGGLVGALFGYREAPSGQ